MRQEEGFWLLSPLLLSAGMGDVIHNAVKQWGRWFRRCKAILCCDTLFLRYRHSSLLVRI
jgi:hypothetical protein